MFHSQVFVSQLSEAVGTVTKFKCYVHGAFVHNKVSKAKLYNANIFGKLKCR